MNELDRKKPEPAGERYAGRYVVVGPRELCFPADGETMAPLGETYHHDGILRYQASFKSQHKALRVIGMAEYFRLRQDKGTLLPLSQTNKQRLKPRSLTSAIDIPDLAV